MQGCPWHLTTFLTCQVYFRHSLLCSPYMFSLFTGHSSWHWSPIKHSSHCHPPGLSGTLTRGYCRRRLVQGLWDSRQALHNTRNPNRTREATILDSDFNGDSTVQLSVLLLYLAQPSHYHLQPLVHSLQTLFWHYSRHSFSGIPLLLVYSVESSKIFGCDTEFQLFLHGRQCDELLQWAEMSTKMV